MTHTKSELDVLLKTGLELVQSLKLDLLEEQIKELESNINQPGFWDDPQTAAKINQKLSTLIKEKDNIDKLNNQLENVEIAFDLGEKESFERLWVEVNKNIEILENSQFLTGKYDSQGVHLSIHAGAGGVDAQDWVAMLTSMYQAFCKNQGFNCTIISLSPGEEAGLKSVFLEIKGENAFGLLKEESGTHRLVRLSPFNSGNTRETSFALVETLPDSLDTEMEDFEIDEDDLKWDYFMSSGKGGQSVNTTYSAVRVVHTPTKISVVCQNERSQQQNKAQALKYLKNKLIARGLEKHKDLIAEIKGSTNSAEWGSQIRNYVLHPYKLVKDLRSGWETANVEEVLEQGHILDIIWSVKRSKANDNSN